MVKEHQSEADGDSISSAFARRNGRVSTQGWVDSESSSHIVCGVMKECRDSGQTHI